jgi:hypothetical protein
MDRNEGDVISESQQSLHRNVVMTFEFQHFEENLSFIVPCLAADDNAPPLSAGDLSTFTIFDGGRFVLNEGMDLSL